MSAERKYIELFWAGVLVLVFIVCILNINKLSNCDFESPYKCEVVHTVGLVPLIGAVVGYMDFGKCPVV